MGIPQFASRIFKARAGVVLFLGGQILMMRQNGKNFWVFPGGTLEDGESLAECAVRELQEETGLGIEIERLLYIGELIDPARQVIDTFFLATRKAGAEGGELNLHPPYPENIDEIKLFDLEQFSQLHVRPSGVHQQVLADWQAGKLALASSDEAPEGARYLGVYFPRG